MVAKGTPPNSIQMGEGKTLRQEILILPQAAQSRARSWAWSRTVWVVFSCLSAGIRNSTPPPISKVYGTFLLLLERTFHLCWWPFDPIHLGLGV